MPDFGKLLDAVLANADTVTAMIPGSTDDIAVAGVRGAIRLIKSFKETTGSTTAELEAKLADLETRVPDALEDEADALRG